MKGIGWPTLVSLGLHGALVIGVLRAPASWVEPEAEPPPVEITIVTPEPELAPEPWPEEEEAPMPEALPEPLPEEAPPPEAPAASAMQLPGPSIEPSEERQEAGGDPLPSVVELPSAAPERQTPESQESEEERQRRLAALIDPRNAARGGFTATGPGPSQRSGPAGLGTGPRGPSEQEIERRLAQGLRAEAMTKSYTTRERVEPRRRSDGSYAWQGHRFTAIIQPDGDVQFQDRGAAEYDLGSGQGSFDLNDLMAGANGQDPYAYERERFMRETEELRHRLEAEYRRRQMAQGVRGLRGRLGRVWATTERSHAQRRRRLFQIWDEIAEDGSADGARSAVITFIRENLPAGSEHAYTDRELERFNARRESRERFDPY